MSITARRGPLLVAGSFLVSGVVHFVRPQVYEVIVPRFLPRPRELVYASGAAEFVCAAGLLADHAWAGKASAVLLAAVFPANVQMALDAGSGRLPGPADNRLVAWARLPLQAVAIRAALRSGQGARR